MTSILIVQNVTVGIPQDVLVNVLDYEIMVRKFKLQLNYSIWYLSNTNQTGFETRLFDLGDPRTNRCNIMAEGFRFMPLDVVRLRTFRLSAWVTCVQH